MARKRSFEHNVFNSTRRQDKGVRVWCVPLRMAEPRCGHLFPRSPRERMKKTNNTRAQEDRTLITLSSALISIVAPLNNYSSLPLPPPSSHGKSVRQCTSC